MAMNSDYPKMPSSALGQGRMGEPGGVTMTKKPTAFSEAEEAFQNVQKLRSRIEVIVNRLIGHEPTDANGECGSPEPDGVLHQLSEGARNASAAIDRAHYALDRLERAV